MHGGLSIVTQETRAKRILVEQHAASRAMGEAVPSGMLWFAVQYIGAQLPQMGMCWQ